MTRDEIQARIVAILADSFELEPGEIKLESTLYEELDLDSIDAIDIFVQLREITGRSRGISMERRLSELRSYVRGWMGYFGLAAQLKLFDKLDQWIRRRIRMCYWKRWRHARTRSRNLMRLGVSRRQAIRHAKSPSVA